MYLDQINIIYYCLYNSNEKQETNCDQTMYDDHMKMLNPEPMFLVDFQKFLFKRRNGLAVHLSMY